MVPATTTQGIAAIGEAVTRERNRRGWSQQQLADIVGYNRTSILNLENPQRGRKPTFDLVLAVTDALELQLNVVNAHRHDFEEVCKVCGQKRGAC